LHSHLKEIDRRERERERARENERERARERKEKILKASKRKIIILRFIKLYLGTASLVEIIQQTFFFKLIIAKYFLEKLTEVLGCRCQVVTLLT
jgi:hypothetical protein